MAKILVTGANGFIGSWLCRVLQERGAHVRGLVRASSDLSLIEGLTLELTRGDLEDPDSLMEATQGADTVYHVAALVSDWGPWERFWRINVHGTHLLLEAAQRSGVRRVVFVSSAAVHSFLDQEEMDERSPQLPTRYGYVRAKREAEEVVLGYHQRGQIEGVIVRPGDVYGPCDRTVLLRLAGYLRRGVLPFLDGGHKLGAFTYIENLIEGIVRAGQAEAAAGEAYILTDGASMTWREFLERLAAEAGWPRPRLSVPSALAWPVAVALETTYDALGIDHRPPLTRYLVEHMSADFAFSIAKARRDLGYVPPVGIDEAIRRSAAWLRDAAGKDGSCHAS